MTRQYSRYSTSTPEADDSYGDSPGRGADSYRHSGSYSGGAAGSYGSSGAATDLADRPDTDRLDADHLDSGDYDAGGHDAADYDDYDDVYAYDEPIDRRWVWVAGVAGAILLVAVICTVVILGGGDSGPVTATLTPAAPTTSHAAPTTTPSAAAPAPTARPVAPPAGALAPETVTTVTPTPTAAAPTEAAAAPDAASVPAPVAAAANTVVYRITGNRPLLDLVTVIYTDSQGALQTDLNVALPWTKSIALNPGVSLSSVTATSLTGQLNCSITDGAGTPIAAQNNNTMITTCTR